jgi:hypothetical protein
MFSKDRHQPYPLLQGSFNIWKAYIPSRQHVLTCAFPINENGSHIPFGYHPTGDTSKYTIRALVRRVGLPKSDETRDRGPLVDLWKTQNLFDFDPNKVDDVLIQNWKVQKIVRLLEARDTIFGFRLGWRFADRASGFANPAAPRPAADNGSAELQAFVKRLYEFYETGAQRDLLLDPRRHPPELVADPWNDTNAGNALITVSHQPALELRAAPERGPALGTRSAGRHVQPQSRPRRGHLPRRAGGRIRRQQQHLHRPNARE